MNSDEFDDDKFGSFLAFCFCVVVVTGALIVLGAIAFIVSK